MTAVAWRQANSTGVSSIACLHSLNSLSLVWFDMPCLMCPERFQRSIFDGSPVVEVGPPLYLPVVPRGRDQLSRAYTPILGSDWKTRAP